MIDIIDLKKCCGCGSCIQRCPKQCISMRIDNEGFWYPDVDHYRCIDCGLCEKVCPCLQDLRNKEPQQVYAAITNNENLRQNSSSGGVFSLLALKVLKDGGVVAGAAFTTKWQVHMVCIKSADELWRLQGSKYVQADTCNTFCEVEKFLKEGRTVLYSGTPCQIKALKLFLKKYYENLYAVDVACHGVPSPGVWQDYLDEISKNALKTVCGKSAELSSIDTMSLIKDIKFREKSLGWRKYRIVFDIAKSSGNGKSELSSIHYDNPFFRAFNSSLIIRPSCTFCPAKHGNSNSDLTIGDYWGIENVAPEIDDNKGVSLVLVNSIKGKFLLNSVDIKLVESCYEDAIKCNAGIRESTKFHEKREVFFQNYKKKKSISSYMQRILHQSLLQRVMNFIYRRVKI